MRLVGTGAAVRRARLLVAGLLLLALVPQPSAPLAASELSSSTSSSSSSSSSSTEIRALWVLRTSLASPESIATLVRSAREHGFNTLLVQVRGRGDSYFNGGIEPRAVELQRQPVTFDPLGTVLTSAHDAGLRVHAWINVNLVSSAAELPLARTHLVQRHPDWLMVPREIAQDLARVEPESPGYVGKLARWTRAQNGGVEGLYASPILPAAVAHVDAVVRDLIRRYALDGVHLDYARYPSERFDYSRAAIAEFRTVVRPHLAATVRRDLDARATEDLFAYPDALADDWMAFRIARMTALVSRLRNTIKAERPDSTVTVAAAPDLEEARTHRLQDWGAWLEAGIVDAVCPMAYTPEPGRFAEQIAAARNVAGGRAVWAGIGAYRLTPAQTIENIETARRLGAAGVVLFSYDSLTDPRQTSPDYLAVVGRSAFARSASSPGTR